MPFLISFHALVCLPAGTAFAHFFVRFRQDGPSDVILFSTFAPSLLQKERNFLWKGYERDLESDILDHIRGFYDAEAMSHRKKQEDAVADYCLWCLIRGKSFDQEKIEIAGMKDVADTTFQRFATRVGPFTAAAAGKRKAAEAGSSGGGGGAGAGEEAGSFRYKKTRLS